MALDGPDGVGKTTQLKLLSKYLTGQGKTVHVTRALGGAPIGEALRQVSLSSENRPAATDVYIALAMYVALAQDIAARKARGEVILIDRSPLAMIAYNAYGGQLPDRSSDKLTPTKQQIFELCVATCQAWQIDLLLFLDAPQEVLNARRRERRVDDYFENQNATFHHRVREGYEAGEYYLQSLPELATHLVKVNAAGDVAAIHKSIVKIIDDVQILRI